MQLTTDQQAIVNLCIKIQGAMQDNTTEPRMAEPLMQLVSNALIDLNRIANALDERNKLDQIKDAVNALSERADQIRAEDIGEFGMWLTTRDKVIKVGGSETVYAMTEALAEFKKMKGYV